MCGKRETNNIDICPNIVQQMDQITSKEVLAGYLDRPAETVLEVKEVAKMVQRSVHQTLNEKQAEMLLVALSTAHEQTNWRQVEANLDELEFQSVWRSEDTAEMQDDQIVKLTKSLQSLHNSVAEEVRYLQKEYDNTLNELENHILNLERASLDQDSNSKLLAEVDAKLQDYEAEIKRST